MNRHEQRGGTEMKQRQDLGYGDRRDNLPSRFWEPGAEEEHDQEATELWIDDEPLPFE